MTRWFRPVAYSVIAVLALLAIFGDAPADETGAANFVVAAPRAPLPASVASEAARSATNPSAMPPRDASAFEPALFSVDRQPLPPTAVLVEAAPPPPADIKILGWLLTDAQPHVFVEWNGDDYTLTPTQSVGDTYRFDSIGGGFADFTYLPTGAARRYAVSDPALIQE